MTFRISIGIKLFLGCLLLTSNALACSTSAWSPGESGAVAANDPSNGVPRVSGSCGFKVTGTGFVQDNSPDAEGQFIGRFYFLPQFGGTGSTKIFVAYSDEASIELFSINYNGTSITLDATAPATGGGSASVAISNNHWHLIEFSWINNAVGSLWVDADATTDPASGTFASGLGMVESVRLGAPEGFGGLTGMAVFDDYVSRRSLPVGALLAGDANLDDTVDSADLTAIVEEFLYGTYAGGVVDCNLDSEINSGDVNCAVALF